VSIEHYSSTVMKGLP